MSEVKIHGLSAEGEAYRAALVAIQELHVPALGWGVPLRCGHCCYEHPCPTRRLADDALGGDNNG